MLVFLLLLLVVIVLLLIIIALNIGFIQMQFLILPLGVSVYKHKIVFSPPPLNEASLFSGTPLCGRLHAHPLSPMRAREHTSSRSAGGSNRITLSGIQTAGTMWKFFYLFGKKTSLCRLADRRARGIVITVEDDFLSPAPDCWFVRFHHLRKREG